MKHLQRFPSSSDYIVNVFSRQSCSKVTLDSTKLYNDKRDHESPIMKKTLPYEKGTVPEEVKFSIYDAKLSANKEMLFWKTFK